MIKRFIKENCKRGVSWWWQEEEANLHASWQELKNDIEQGSVEGVTGVTHAR